MELVSYECKTKRNAKIKLTVNYFSKSVTFFLYVYNLLCQIMLLCDYCSWLLNLFPYTNIFSFQILADLEVDFYFDWIYNLC